MFYVLVCVFGIIIILIFFLTMAMFAIQDIITEDISFALRTH